MKNKQTKKEKQLEKSAELYMRMCNYWYCNVIAPGLNDGYRHTSKECRRVASEIFELLEIKR